MRMLTRRTQLLLDEERHERLSRRARATGSSVGALIRDAIDLAYPETRMSAREAADRLLAAEPMPVDDWPTMKREIETRWEKHLDFPAPASEE